MHFLAPAIALLGLLFVAPIVIHLLGRNQARPRRFAALELLVRSAKRAARRSRIEELLLVALRAAVIFAIPFIIARPYLERPKAGRLTPHRDKESVVLVLDDSASMTMRRNGRALFEVAKERAGE